MNGVCAQCKLFSTYAKANLSRRTGEQLYRSWCNSCEKKRKDVWRLRNKETHNATSRNWYANNLTKARDVKKQWNESNKETVKVLQKKWKKDNVTRCRAYTNSRRHKLRAATPLWLNELQKLVLVETYHLAQLRGLTVDHIVPLNGNNVCGLHVPWNLQLLTASENYKKSNKLLLKNGNSR